MTVRVTSDPETDRLLSMRASSSIPLPPEICLADPRRSPEYFRMAAFYDAYGLGSHPVVALLKKEAIDTMMSSALARSQHLDRIAHYGAWLGNETVTVEDLTSPPPDGTEGRASGPRRGRSPFPRGRRRSRRPSGPWGTIPCPDPSPVGRVSGRRAPAASVGERRVRATNRPCGRRPGRKPRRPPAAFQRRRKSPLPSPPDSKSEHRGREQITFIINAGPRVPAHLIPHNNRIMDQLENFDLKAEERRMHQLEAHFERCCIQGLAEQAAMMEHPVVEYVKNLPVEPPTYPAIEYLKLAQQVGRPVQEVYSLVQDGTTQFRDQDGNTIRFRKEDHEFICWSMPGRDRQRAIDRRCGFIYSPSGGIVHSRCPDHPEHYCKGKRHHCWSMACYECMNDTALRQGVKAETKLKAFKRLREKEGAYVGDIGHWVVSPPQELVKCLMQTRREFDNLAKYVELSLQDVGATAGITIFHPWRMKDDRWELSPHFHNLVYGHLDTDKFRRDNPGWIIKKVHPREKIRSIRHTAAYLYTHMGIGISEVEPDSVDWDTDFLDHMIPGIKSPDATYTERDYENLVNGKGRLLGDTSDIDWEKWTMDRLSGELRVRQWGGVARNRMRTLGFHRQYKIRVCKECGEILRTYEGTGDAVGNYVRYIQDNQIFTLAHNFDLAYSAYLRYKDDLRKEHLTLSDFASVVPFAVSTLEILPQNNDLVMSGPFEEPDEFFLRRQAVALGEPSTV